MTAHPDVPEGTVLVLTERTGTAPEAKAALAGGRWIITLPQLPPGTIFDAHAVMAGASKRLQAGPVEQSEGSGWRIYATQGGWLSLKAVVPRQMTN